MANSAEFSFIYARLTCLSIEISIHRCHPHSWFSMCQAAAESSLEGGNTISNVFCWCSWQAAPPWAFQTIFPPDYLENFICTTAVCQLLLLFLHDYPDPYGFLYPSQSHLQQSGVWGCAPLSHQVELDCFVFQHQTCNSANCQALCCALLLDQLAKLTCSTFTELRPCSPQACSIC